MTAPPAASSADRSVSGAARSERATSVADRVAAIAGAITTVGMIATPLARQGGKTRRMLSSVVVGAMFATTTANAARRWGVSRAAGAAATTAVATTVVERIGTRTGLPFGRYHYTPALRPQVHGVPAIVPLAWFAMALPAREAASAALGAPTTGARSGARRNRTVLGAAALTGWDLFLDPQMTAEGYWRWVRRGVYRGIPLSNFAGWFLTGLGVMALLDAWLPPTDHAGAPQESGDATLVGEYAFMAVMETVGFARFFRDPLVAAVGGLGMLPIAGTAVVRQVTSRRVRGGSAG